MVENTTDISVVGPGIWWTLHSLAAKAQTPATRKTFFDFVTYLKQSFPCEKCRPHINKFFDTHPVTNYDGDMINGKDVGLFRMTHIMHSQVNERLKKAFFPFEKAYDIYFNLDSCNMDICPGVVEEPAKYERKANRKPAPKKFSLMRIQ